jgi:cytochrome c
MPCPSPARRERKTVAFRLLSAAGLVLSIAAPAGAADIEAGKAVFNRCKICHRLEAGAASPVGPNLHGVFGRKAGTMPGYDYSEAMKNAGVVWDEETLSKYLRDPKGFIPGNKMAFPGIKNDTELANLLAYLKEATK